MDHLVESPRSAEHSKAATAFEVIEALPGLCTLVKRSPTLDGQLPLRAAQHCSPVFEGNAAGFQICLNQPMSLRRSRGGVAIDMTAPALEQIRRSVRGAVRRLVAAGLLQEGGVWHRILADDAMPSRGHRILLWSGFLVRPAAGVALRVGGAFNRRSRISVVEHAIVDRRGFTPLVLEIDGRTLEREPTLIVDEIGCVLPVASDAQLTLSSIRRAPAVVKAFQSFFDGHYFETKKNKPTGTYRRLMRKGEEAASATCRAQVYTAGPDVHSLSTLRRFHHPGGISAVAPDGISLPICTVRNIAPLSARWDGQMFTREHKDLTAAVRLLARDWRAAGGDVKSDAFEFLTTHFVGPARDEPPMRGSSAIVDRRGRAVDRLFLYRPARCTETMALERTVLIATLKNTDSLMSRSLWGTRPGCLLLKVLEIEDRRVDSTFAAAGEDLAVRVDDEFRAAGRRHNEGRAKPDAIAITRRRGMDERLISRAGGAVGRQIHVDRVVDGTGVASVAGASDGRVVQIPPRRIPIHRAADIRPKWRPFEAATAWIKTFRVRPLRRSFAASASRYCLT